MDRLREINFDDIQKAASALTSDIRINILKALHRRSMNVNEIAETLHMPVSTAISGVLKLEKAGLIDTELQPAIRGTQKICSVNYDSIVLKIGDYERPIDNNIIEISMPVGNYVDYRIWPYCGLASEEKVIGIMDDPKSFYEPDRIYAQLLWFKKGYVEYRFPNRVSSGAKVANLTISLELCSEYPTYNNDFPSDITVWINGCEIGTWTSPGDFGGDRGVLTPDWWGSNHTQYGMLKNWLINSKGSFIDGSVLSGVNISDLNLDRNPHITVRIGVKDNARHCGGINIFGRKFGNYNQDIILKMEIE